MRTMASRASSVYPQQARRLYLQMQAMQEAAQLGRPQLAAHGRRPGARRAQQPGHVRAGVPRRPAPRGMRADHRQQPLQLALADAELVQMPQRADQVVEVVAGEAAAAPRMSRACRASGSRPA